MPGPVEQLAQRPHELVADGGDPRYRQPQRVRKSRRREREDQHQAQPEARHRVHEQRGEREHVVELGVLPDRLNGAHRATDYEDQHERHPAQHQGVRKRVGDDRGNRSVLAEAVAEVAGEEGPQPPEVLLMDGSVEPEVLSHAIDDLGADVRVEVGGGRVARRQVEEKEDQGDDADEDRHRVEEPPQGETDQGAPSRSHQVPTSASSPRKSGATP